MRFDKIFLFGMLGIIFLACSSQPAKPLVTLAPGVTPRLQVVGCGISFRDSSWSNPLLGLALNTELTDQLWQTKRFVLQDENSQVRQEREKVLRLAWATGNPPNYQELAPDSSIAYKAWSTLQFCGRPSDELSIGVVHSRTQQLLIRVETCLQKNGSTPVCAQGDGSTEIKAQSFVLSISEDHLQSQGMDIAGATRQAIQNSLQKLLGTR